MENLSRLSSKPGVQSTLILSKTNGAIIRSTGLLSASFSLPSESPELGSALAGTDGNRPAPLDEKGGYSSQRAEGNLNAEAVAKMVFSFVSAGGDLANCLEEGGDVQLLRLRTRKNEIVIVPGQWRLHLHLVSLHTSNKLIYD